MGNNVGVERAGGDGAAEARRAGLPLWAALTFVVASFLGLAVAAEDSGAEESGSYTTTTLASPSIFVDTGVDLRGNLVEFAVSPFQQCQYWTNTEGVVTSYVDDSGTDIFGCDFLELARSQPSEINGSTAWAARPDGVLDSGESVVAAPMTPARDGMWLITSRGRALPYGRAEFYGDMADHPDGPLSDIVGAAVTHDGEGYWLFDDEGNVRSFGSATDYGSLPDVLGSLGMGRVDAPIVAMVASPDDGGYVLVGADGGAFAFGSAEFLGSIPALLPAGVELDAPIVAAFGGATFGGFAAQFGYTLVGADGGTFAFGMRYWGSLAGVELPAPIVAGAGSIRGEGHLLTDANGTIYPFGFIELCRRQSVDCKSGLPGGLSEPIAPKPEPPSSPRFVELERVVRETLADGSPSVDLRRLWCEPPMPAVEPGDSFTCGASTDKAHINIDVTVGADGAISFKQQNPVVDIGTVERQMETTDPALGTVECGDGIDQVRWISPILCTASGAPGTQLEIVPDDGSWTWSVVDIIDPSDIVLTIDVESPAIAGERLWIDVTVTNTSDKRAVWYGGGWDVPVWASLNPASASEPGDPPATVEQATEFRPDDAALIDFLEGGGGRVQPVLFQPEGVAGSQRDGGRTANLRIHLFEPGESITTRLGGLVRVGRGELNNDFVVTATFQPRSPNSQELLDLVTATTTVQLRDPTERATTEADAIATLVSNPYVETYLELTRLEDELPATLVQMYTAEMSWAFGRWELWIEPKWAFGNPLRVVYDPETGSVTDVRILAGNISPSDDPDREPRPFGSFYELILRSESP